ncbi:MAG: RNA polymerase sigma factor [Gemmataceae bacterium]
MHPDADRDEWLMARTALGEREPLGTLARRYAGPLVGFLARMVGDAHTAEELFQDVFLAVWRRRGQYQFPRPFKAWLYAIAVNRGRAAFRSRRSALPLPDVPPADPAASPADVAIAAETAQRIAAAIGRLPPKQRAVVALRVWDEMSYAEIAGIVGGNEATVRSHMYHGLKAVRADVGDLS